MQYWMFTFAVLILLIPSITTLKCYVCNSNVDGACAGSSGLDKFVTNCSQTVSPYCRKAVQTVDTLISTVRVCGSQLGSKACYSSSGTNSANICSCNSDLCNTAINLNQRPRIITIISSIAVLVIPLFILR